MRDIISFLNDSPVNFLAVKTITDELRDAGFVELDPAEAWDLTAGGKYFVTKNGSAVFAFIVGTDPLAGCKIISAHSDSPGFRIKPCAEYEREGFLQFNTEVYGGPILYTWFDRPLSIAGRVVLRSSDPLKPQARLVDFKRPLLTIPHLAIHFNRQVNDGNPISKQRDMMPVAGIVNDQLRAGGCLLRMLADELQVSPSDILDFDLSLYDTTPACRVGINNEFISSGRIDDLSMCHAALTALLASEKAPQPMTRVMAIFDNEETGSGTKQGACSPILADILLRVSAAQGGGMETYLRSIERSFMVSADNGHGVHPNYVSKQDPTNHPRLGSGPVIKVNANCKYMTDADSAAVFRTICEQAGVPCQYFVNNSDVAGGSTLGNLLTSQIPLRGVDMGEAIWAMHSVRETAAAIDHEYTIRAFTHFYNL